MAIPTKTPTSFVFHLNANSFLARLSLTSILNEVNFLFRVDAALWDCGDASPVALMRCEMMFLVGQCSKVHSVVPILDIT